MGGGVGRRKGRRKGEREWREENRLKIKRNGIHGHNFPALLLEKVTSVDVLISSLTHPSQRPICVSYTPRTARLPGPASTQIRVWLSRHQCSRMRYSIPTDPGSQLPVHSHLTSTPQVQRLGSDPDVLRRNTIVKSIEFNGQRNC